MSQPVGNLGRTCARWMATHADELKDVIPLPDHTWKWSETDLTRSQFSYLRRYGLIEQVGEQEWRTTNKCIQAIGNYGRIPQDEIGMYVDYDRSWFDTPTDGRPQLDSNCSKETFDAEQANLDSYR